MVPDWCILSGQATFHQWIVHGRIPDRVFFDANPALGDPWDTWKKRGAKPYQPHSMIVHGSDKILGGSPVVHAKPQISTTLDEFVSCSPTQCWFCQHSTALHARSPNYPDGLFAKSHRCYNEFVMDNLCDFESDQASFVWTRGLQGLVSVCTRLSLTFFN